MVNDGRGGIDIAVEFGLGRLEKDKTQQALGVKRKGEINRYQTATHER